MPRHLWQCTAEIDQAALVAERLRLGETVYHVALWFGGLDRPTRMIGRAKAILRAEGLVVESVVDTIEEAGGFQVQALGWRVKDSADR